MRRSHYLSRWMLAVFMALVFEGLAKSAGAEVKTFIQEYRYRAGQGDDKNAIQIVAISMKNGRAVRIELKQS
jgi:hypothetical protein